MHSKIILLMYCIFHLSALQAQEADRCRDILALGFYNKTETYNSGDFINDVRKWLISDKFRGYVKNGGTGFKIGIPIKKIPVNIGFNSGNNEYEQLKKSLSTGKTDYINSSFASYVAHQVVDKDVVKAWSKCMSDNAQKTGLQFHLDGDKNGDYFSLLLYWVPRLNVNSCKLKTPFIIGASYDTTLLKNSLQIGTEPVPIYLIRQNNASIFVSANTTDNIGSISIHVPEKEIYYSETKKIEFQNGNYNIEYDAGYRGNITIDEVQGSLRIVTDNNAIGTGTYILPLKIDQHAKKIQVSFSGIRLRRSSNGGNTTLLQVCLSSSILLSDQTIIVDKKFETTDNDPLTTIPYFELESIVEEFQNKSVFLVIIVRDAWNKNMFSVTIPAFNMTQTNKQ